MTFTFTEKQLQALSSEIDSQLQELVNAPIGEGYTKDADSTKTAIPAKQKQLLEEATGENAETFMKKFASQAKKNLCEKGGSLYDLHEKAGNISKKAILGVFGNILLELGLPIDSIHTVVVASTVIVLHIGIETFCADYK